MLPMRRLHPLRFPRFLSRGSEVCRRRLVSPRLAAFCPSGMLNPLQKLQLFEKGVKLTAGCSDGIARVHGMSNVQAEELVE